MLGKWHDKQKRFDSASRVRFSSKLLVFGILGYGEATGRFRLSSACAPGAFRELSEKTIFCREPGTIGARCLDHGSGGSTKYVRRHGSRIIDKIDRTTQTRTPPIEPTTW